MLKEGSGYTETFVLSLWLQMLAHYIVPLPRSCAVSRIHTQSPKFWKPLVFLTVFFLSLLHLKADDTYLQLKKDLEYLDLKVRDVKRLASLGHAPF